MNIKKILLVMGVATCGSALAITQPVNSEQEKIHRLERQLSQLEYQVRQLQTSQLKNKKQQTKLDKIKSAVVPQEHLDNYNVFGNSVVIAPFTSQPTYNTGQELLVNSPSINEDAKLLYRRQVEQKKMAAAGLPLPTQPRLVLSGKVEGQGIYTNPYVGSDTSDIDLSGAELDLFAEMIPMVNGFIAMNYDNKASSTPRRISNSRIKLDKGFIVIGDFNRSPFYGSIGQVAAPFGRYGSNMIVDPLTKNIGYTKARAITFGYSPGGVLNTAPYGSVFIFKGDSQYGNSGIVKQGGFDLGYRYSGGDLYTELGASYIRSISDAVGIQEAGYSGTGMFAGLDQSGTPTGKSSFESINHEVGGADIHGSLNYKKFNFLAEYISALRSYAVNDISFNNHGAKPRAFNIEGAYVFTAFKHPSSFAIGYGATSQALAYNIPKQRYDAAFGVTVLNDTIVTLEYRHDINYGSHDSAMGQGQTAYTSTALGKSDNVLTAKLGVYF